MDGLRQRIRDLAAERGRIILVTLGVVWGTLSLTVVLSFGEGFDLAMTRAMHAGGRDLIRLWSGATTRPFAGLPPGRWIGLVPEDADLIRARVSGVRGTSVEYVTFGDSLVCRGRRVNGRIYGVDPSYGELRNFVPRPGGRFINARDASERRRVVFLGGEMKERLFGPAPAVGEAVEIWGIPFTVIGVLRPKLPLGSYEGRDVEKALIPASTFRVLRGWRYVTYLIVGLESSRDDGRAMADIYRTLGARHGFDPDDEAALSAHNGVEQQRMIHRIVRGVRALLGIVGIVGLLAALVGVANVMYVMVEERTREVGIQMALGSRPAWIARGVLLEGLVVTFAGGALGVLGSAGILRLLNGIPVEDATRGYLGEPVISLVTALAVTAILGLSGCAAGYVPARRAATLDPVDALREE